MQRAKGDKSIKGIKTTKNYDLAEKILEIPTEPYYQEVKRAVMFIVRIRPCLSICLKCLIRRSLSKMDRLDKTLQRIDKFNLDRDWNQFHSPENLSKSISIEAAELLECFQWDENNYDLEAVKEEFADVMNYCLQMALVLKLDPIEIINKKIDKNEKKYPVEKAKGVSTKYNKL